MIAKPFFTLAVFAPCRRCGTWTDNGAWMLDTTIYCPACGEVYGWKRREGK